MIAPGPAREPHLLAFRQHVEKPSDVEVPDGHPPTPASVAEEAPAALPRPAWVEPGWVDRLHALADDPRAIAVAVALLTLVVGVAFYRSALGSEGPPAPPSDGAATEVTTTSTSGGELVVHVSGAVVSPGVYRLAPTARVGQAVEAAGGALEGADVHRLNLAARVGDGQQVYVPRPGEPVPAAAAAGSASEGGVVNVNLATGEQLESLPGVGPTLAQAIVSERERRGGFRSVNDLLSVRGIGEKRLADLRPRVTV